LATVVDAIGRENKEPVLVGYIVTGAGHHWVTGAGHHWSPARLRTELRSLLPDYMVPSIFVLLGSFPLTSSGKIDREKLRDAYRSLERNKSTASKTAELLLGKLWADALDLPEIGREDNFFELGGDSLIATVVAARLHTMLGVEIGLEIFADYPTLAAFAQVVEDAIKVPAAAFMPEITSASRAAPLPLLK
jgi:acyl carrier protein